MVRDLTDFAVNMVKAEKTKQVQSKAEHLADERILDILIPPVRKPHQPVRQELKGMNNRQFMSEETSKKVFETFNKVYKTGEPTKALGWDLIRKDGEKRYVETSISLMRDPKGEPAGFRGIARDITERKRLEKAKERAINHLSHELGTPLSIIRGVIKRFPDELKKGNMERIQEWIERMNRNLIRLRDLQRKIDDILNERPGQERERILNLVEAAIAFLDELKDEHLKESAEVIRQKIIKRLDSLYKVEEVQKEKLLPLTPLSVRSARKLVCP